MKFLVKVPGVPRALVAVVRDTWPCIEVIGYSDYKFPESLVVKFYPFIDNLMRCVMLQFGTVIKDALDVAPYGVLLYNLPEDTPLDYDVASTSLVNYAGFEFQGKATIAVHTGDYNRNLLFSTPVAGRLTGTGVKFKIRAHNGISFMSIREVEYNAKEQYVIECVNGRPTGVATNIMHDFINKEMWPNGTAFVLETAMAEIKQGLAKIAKITGELQYINGMEPEWHDLDIKDIALRYSKEYM